MSVAVAALVIAIVSLGWNLWREFVERRRRRREIEPRVDAEVGRGAANTIVFQYQNTGRGPAFDVRCRVLHPGFDDGTNDIFEKRLASEDGGKTRLLKRTAGSPEFNFGDFRVVVEYEDESGNLIRRRYQYSDSGGLGKPVTSRPKSRELSA